MISRYELRLGNRVLVDKNLQQVSMITGTTVFTIDAEEGHEQKVSEQSFEQIESVPLTDDVLKQCGFVYHDYFKFWQHITTVSRQKWISIVITTLLILCVGLLLKKWLLFINCKMFTLC
jgi:hypothetical protein